MQIGRARAVDPDDEDGALDFLPLDLRVPLPFAGNTRVDHQEAAQVESDVDDRVLQQPGVGSPKSSNQSPQVLAHPRRIRLIEVDAVVRGVVFGSLDQAVEIQLSV